MIRPIRLIAWSALAAALACAPLLAQQRDRERSSHERVERTTPPASTQPGASGRSAPSFRRAYSERYGVLEQRNIFVKERSRGSSRSDAAAPSTQARRSAEESLVLRGIAIEDIGYRAYFEDLNTSATVKVWPGEKLARGQVVLIALDAIAYEHDGNQRWIPIGSDLTGKQASAPAQSASSSAAATTGPTSLPTDPNDPNLTLEQRMRLRRLQAEQRR